MTVMAISSTVETLITCYTANHLVVRVCSNVLTCTAYPFTKFAMERGIVLMGKMSSFVIYLSYVLGFCVARGVSA